MYITNIDTHRVLVYYLTSTVVWERKIKLNFTNDKPIYVQIVDSFYYKICNESLKPGNKLPSVRETALEFGVNPNTVQRAYAEMERNEIIYPKRGQGSFVTEQVDVINELKKNLATEKMKEFINFMGNIGYEFDEVVEYVNTFNYESLDKIREW